MRFAIFSSKLCLMLWYGNLFLQTPEQINSRYVNSTGIPLQSTDAGFAYDAMWTIATALNRTEDCFKRVKSSLSINNFTYKTKEITEHFKKAINQTNFIGVTVSVTEPRVIQFLDWREGHISHVFGKEERGECPVSITMIKEVADVQFWFSVFCCS